MKYDLVLVYPPNDTSPNPKHGGARVAVFEDENSSIVSEENGLSLIPLHAVYMDEDVEDKKLDKMLPERVHKVELSMETYENFFDHVPKDDEDEGKTDVAKRFWEIEIKDNFPKEALGKLVFKLHSQFIFNKKTVFYPYLKRQVLRHVNDIVFKRKAKVDLGRPLENAEEALNLAFWLVAITVVTEGMTCVLIHNQGQGPLVMPRGLHKLNWAGHSSTHRYTTDPRKKLLSNLKPKDNTNVQEVDGGQSKDLEPLGGCNSGDEEKGVCSCGPGACPGKGCDCGAKQ
jgi:hypothetical protein